MNSPLRDEVIHYIEMFAKMLPETIQRVLEVGIAGDTKPGGNYYLFKDKDYKTLDIDEKYKPDYVYDICKTDLPNESFDLIILSQTLEHIPTPQKAIDECYRLLSKGGYLIIDCPWLYPYHAEDDFLDYWRISKDGFGIMLDKFESIIKQGKYCTSALGRKL